jgi:hypothetical protein
MRSASAPSGRRRQLAEVRRAARLALDRPDDEAVEVGQHLGAIGGVAAPPRLHRRPGLLAEEVLRDRRQER